MNSLEEMWLAALAEAQIKAQKTGRGDVADYLALKSANDAIRQMACEWLMQIFQDFAAKLPPENFPAKPETIQSHRFDVRGATMVGSLLRYRQGLRNLTIEAGFPRTPADGFVRGNGLACARISHFGFPKQTDELLLARPNNSSPSWYIVSDENTRTEFLTSRIPHHFKTFLT